MGIHKTAEGGGGGGGGGGGVRCFFGFFLSSDRGGKRERENGPFFPAMQIFFGLTSGDNLSRSVCVQ